MPKKPDFFFLDFDLDFDLARSLLCLAAVVTVPLDAPAAETGAACAGAAWAATATAARGAAAWAGAAASAAPPKASVMDRNRLARRALIDSSPDSGGAPMAADRAYCPMRRAAVTAPGHGCSTTATRPGRSGHDRPGESGGRIGRPDQTGGGEAGPERATATSERIAEAIWPSGRVASSAKSSTSQPPATFCPPAATMPR